MNRNIKARKERGGVGGWEGGREGGSGRRKKVDKVMASLPEASLVP